MTRNIDEQIRMYYSQQSLSSETLTRLRGLATKPSPAHTDSLRMWQTLAVAATVALAFLAGVLFVSRGPTTGSQPVATPVASADVTNRLAEEVAHRHHNCSHVDFTASELAALADAMPKLDFAIAAPDGIDLSMLTLQGAHYCVINGQIALHATYIDSSGNTVSLLETRTSPQLASMKHATHELGDVEVEMWQKGEVVIAMARLARSV